MPSSPDQPDIILGEELTAYLDGELSREESEQLEQRLSEQEHVRSELQRFDRVWNALDQLPQATVGDSFTRTTIEMAAVEAEKDLALQTRQLPIQKRNYRLQLIGLCAAAMLVGFLIFSMLLPNRNRELYQNLPVITQLDAYNEIPSVDFLKQLHADAGEWLLEDWDQETAPAFYELSLASSREQRNYVEQLDDDGRTDLAQKTRRYGGLSPAMQSELEARHEAILDSPDAEQLQRTMLAYHAWLSSLDGETQGALRLIEDPAERIERIQSIHRDMQRRSARRLTTEQYKSLWAAKQSLDDDPRIVRLHAAMMQEIDTLPHMQAKEDDSPQERWRKFRFNKFKEAEPSRAAHVVLHLHARNDDQEQQEPPAMREFRKAIESRLIAALDEPSSQQLKELSCHERSVRLNDWLWTSAWRQQSQFLRKPDDAELERFFISGEITPEQQQRLLDMPRDDMLRELERLYVGNLAGEDTEDYQFRNRWRRRNSDDRRGPSDDRRRGDRPAPPDEDESPRGPRPDGPPPFGPPFDGPRDGRPPRDRNF